MTTLISFQKSLWANASVLDHPNADTLGRAGHDLVHERFCIEIMVEPVESIYDEGARAVHPSEMAAV